MMVTGLVQIKLITGFADIQKDAMESSGNVAHEATTGIRTVAALGLEPHMQRSFDRTLVGPRALAVRQGFVGGASMGFAQFSMFSAYALCF